MKGLESYIEQVRELASKAPDKRNGHHNTRYLMSDVVMAAFSIFFMQSPSFLAHQRALAEHKGRSNLETLFKNVHVPSDNHIRQTLDGVPPEHFEELFFSIISKLKEDKRFAVFQPLNGRVLIALDGSEYFSSYKIKCSKCSTRKHGNGEVEYFHRLLGAAIVTVGQNTALPLPPEFISPQDGAEKQDCEQRAAARWLSKHYNQLRELKPVFLGDDLYARQPFCLEVLGNEGAGFIFTCKQSSHKILYEYLEGVELERLSVNKKLPGKGLRTYNYSWLHEVPLRDGEDALKVNWISLQISDPNGKAKATTHSFVTDIVPDESNIEQLIACARSRWKIENETFNVLKNNGYNLEHNFGHGKETLAAVLVVLNLLSFSIHNACRLQSSLWREAEALFSAKHRLFIDLWSLCKYLLFPSWHSLFSTIISGGPPPNTL
jgi:hypothetical protein